MLRNRERWCAKHRGGWCAAMINRPFRPGIDAVATACEHWVTLPTGCERRVPTCQDCLALLPPRDKESSDDA